MAIKDIIYKAAKKISTTEEMDITPEELANLALYKVMNLPYFEGCNNFLTLHYNVFNEISLGHTALSALKGYTNGNHESFVILMDKKDNTDSKIASTDKILKQSDRELLKEFIEIMNASQTLKEMSDKLSIVEDRDPVFLNKIFAITETGDYYGNPLMRGLSEVTKYKGDGTHDEYMLQIQTKVQYYRSVRSVRGLKDIVFSLYSLKSLVDQDIKEIIENASNLDIEQLTGIEGFTKQNLKTFHKSHPEEYSKSLYKIFKENKDEDVRTMLSFDLLKLKDAVKDINKRAKKLFEHKTAEELLNQYDDKISPIVKLIEKKYPQITKSVNDNDYELKTFIFNTSNEKNTFIDKETPLEIYQSEYMSTNYPSIRGNSFYKEFYKQTNGIYIAANNGLEDLLAGEAFLRNEIRSGGYSISINNLRLNTIYENGRDIDINIKRNVIEEFVKMAQEKNVPFVHDIIERGRNNNSKFNNDMHTITNELQEKYPNVIFVNDGFSVNEDDRLKTDIKAELLLHMAEYPYSKMIIANKKLEEFFKTEEFKKLIKLDYFERKEDGTVDKKIKAILNELNKNKMKVSP